MSVLIRCWGDYALFTRPEMKAERVSYDVITPSAARGIFDAIFWHRGIEWVIQEIYVRQPIQFISVRRNELKTLLSSSALRTAIRKRSVLDTCDPEMNRTQRASLILKNVEYYIRAYARVDEQIYDGTKEKANSVILKRLRRGACYHHPYFGCREFPVNFELADTVPPCPDCLRGDIDLNWMLWDMDFQAEPNPIPVFFRPVMHDGFIQVPGRSELV